MDCILKSFMDTVTIMIVDIVGVRGSPKLAEDHCERVETLPPLHMFYNNPSQRKRTAVCLLVVCYSTSPTCILYFYIELINKCYLALSLNNVSPLTSFFPPKCSSAHVHNKGKHH